MDNVTKIVQQRLKASMTATDHPDANVLTAFSERALPDRERSQLMEHLSRCAECRDVVALALPTEESMAAVVRPSRSGWLTWPILRWSLVAAGIIVIGSFGVLRYEGSKGSKEVALTSEPSSAIAQGAGNQPKSALPSEEVPQRNSSSLPASQSRDIERKSEVAETKKTDKGLTDEGLVSKSPAPPSDNKGVGSRAGVLRGQTLPHGPMPPTQWQQNQNANNVNQRVMFQSQSPAPPASVPASNNDAAVAVSAQSSPVVAPAVGGPVSAEKQIQNLDALPVNGRNFTELTSLAKSNAGEVARAKDAQPPAANAPKTAGAYELSDANTSNFSPNGSLSPESARWTINSAGGLQRSFDQGKTWQTVNVNNGPRDSAGLNLQSAMKSARAKSAAKDAETKPKLIVFRAVAANGPDVWAGAAEANLFHSTDSGDHWIRIQPSWRGVELTGDILSLQFADPQHGRIVTSTAEIWTTADAGQTWDKQ